MGDAVAAVRSRKRVLAVTHPARKAGPAPVALREAVARSRGRWRRAREGCCGGGVFQKGCCGAGVFRDGCCGGGVFL